jgi:hypothetical protein
MVAVNKHDPAPEGVRPLVTRTLGEMYFASAILHDMSRERNIYVLECCDP